jgi:hypothetical protein
MGPPKRVMPSLRKAENTSSVEHSRIGGALGEPELLVSSSSTRKFHIKWFDPSLMGYRSFRGPLEMKQMRLIFLTGRLLISLLERK